MVESSSEKESVLEREIAAFEEQLPSMLEEHRGKYVVFHGDNNLGYWHCQADAINAAYKKLGNVPFLVERVSEYDRPKTFTRDINFVSA